MMEFALIAIALFIASKISDNVVGEVCLGILGVGFLTLAIFTAPYGAVL